MQLNVPSMLITDDDRDFRETLGDVFQRRGFQTLLASDGQEALQIIEKTQIHLLLLDMHMPRLTGLETLRRVKKNRFLLPCILLSAALDEFLAEEARKAEAFSVLSKPVSFEEITSVVAEAMQAAYNWPEFQ